MHRWFIFQAEHIGTKDFHSFGFYILKIIYQHSGRVCSLWGGLVNVLCPNKAANIERQVASIDKKPINELKINQKAPPFRTIFQNIPPKVDSTVNCTEENLILAGTAHTTKNVTALIRDHLGSSNLTYQMISVHANL